MDSIEPNPGKVLIAHASVSITLSPRVICKDEPVFYSGGRHRRQEVRARRFGAWRWELTTGQPGGPSIHHFKVTGMT